MSIQRQLKRLEDNGALASRMVGSARIFSFNQRNPTVRHLRELLAKELELLEELEPDVTAQYYRQRQRPRQAEKRLK